MDNLLFQFAMLLWITGIIFYCALFPIVTKRCFWKKTSLKKNICNVVVCVLLMPMLVYEYSAALSMFLVDSFHINELSVEGIILSTCCEMAFILLAAYLYVLYFKPVNKAIAIFVYFMVSIITYIPSSLPPMNAKNATIGDTIQILGESILILALGYMFYHFLIVPVSKITHVDNKIGRRAFIILPAFSLVYTDIIAIINLLYADNDILVAVTGISSVFVISVVCIGFHYIIQNTIVISELEKARDVEKAKEEAEKAKEIAQQANRAKSDFLANMSHEIRTPINAVLGIDEMILRESTDSKILEYASDIKQAGSMLLSLINDILDFSKIESGKMDIIPVDYDLGILLSDTIDMIRSRAEEKKLQLELNIESNTPVHLHGDEVRLRQIITNILTNAVKYTPEGKVILTVSGKKVSTEAVQLYVSVKDTGIGIKEEDIGRLYDSFQRVDESRNRNIEGTGLGLSITMRLLNLMGSRLEVESAYGEGSDFYFYLEQEQLDDEILGEDIQKYCEKVRGEISVSTEQFYAPDAKILVVDDNEMNLKVFSGLLKNHGMQIDTAMSGKECLARIEQNAYHMIFMDHLMPEMDGVETLRQIRELKTNRSKDAVIIILTANAVSGAREMFLEEGFADYLSKPIIAVNLEKMIQKYLPEELLTNNDLEQKNKIPATSDEAARSAPSENGLVSWEKGKAFFMGDEELYREMLQAFLESSSAMELRQYYEESDFDNYRIKIHAMKANLANIGAMSVSDKAKQLELALVNENNVSYVQENHDEFMKEYERVVSEVRTKYGL